MKNPQLPHEGPGKKLWRTLEYIADVPIDYRRKNDQYIEDFMEHVIMRDKFEHQMLIVGLFEILEMAQKSYEHLHGDKNGKT